jgi:hypothetical protein
VRRGPLVQPRCQRLDVAKCASSRRSCLRVVPKVVPRALRGCSAVVPRCPASTIPGKRRRFVLSRARFAASGAMAARARRCRGTSARRSAANRRASCILSGGAVAPPLAARPLLGCDDSAAAALPAAHAKPLTPHVAHCRVSKSRMPESGTSGSVWAPAGETTGLDLRSDALEPRQ